MARADLLIELVRAGSQGDQVRFRRAVEAVAVEERAKQHHVLAERLTRQLDDRHTLPKSGPEVPSVPHKRAPVFEVNPSRRLEDLVLDEQVLASCNELVEEQLRIDLLRAHGLEPRHRVLLIGPPGNGKTSLAEALANELAVPLVVVQYEEVIASYLGETASRLASVFDFARTRRCVLFLDEFDVLGKERGDEHETGEIKRVVSSLLLQTDALPAHVLLVAATNHPELLDRASWRRFQLKLYLNPPTRAGAEAWFRKLEARVGERLGYAPSTLARRLSGLSYSELEDFGQDVLRQYVLRSPSVGFQEILRERLKIWTVTRSPSSRADG